MLAVRRLLMKPLLLDTYCKAGGAGMGYSLAGFDVVGVDIEPQPRYPFEFIQGDAVEFIRSRGRDFDVIHASPPCQAYSTTASLSKKIHQKLIEPTRAALIATGKPYVMENVPGAPLINPLMLCGTMFGLRTIRHRLFESNPAIWFPPATCNHWGKVAPIWWGDLPSGRTPGQSFFDHYDFVTFAGKNFLACDIYPGLGIDWMTVDEASQAIPPAYTYWLGTQVITRLTLREHRQGGFSPKAGLSLPAHLSV